MLQGVMACKRPCSSDESFERIDIVPSQPPPPQIDGQILEDVPVSKRTAPLSEEKFLQFLDADGRLVDEHGLRRTVFLGGVEPSIRKQVWQFVFGLYPCTSTSRERETILLDYIVKYHELRQRWKTMLVLSSRPGSTPLEQGLIAKYQTQEGSTPPCSPEISSAQPSFDTSPEGMHRAAAGVVSGPVDAALLSETHLTDTYTMEEIQQKLEFMKLQAQVFVNRHKIDVNDMRTNIRVIDKDVPRTDRDVEYFEGRSNPHLTQLRDILVTCAVYNPKLGYAQGMNDILSRFLFVMESEVETFWCFKNYMEKIEYDFSEEGMVKKIDLVRMLLSEVDPVLLRHFEVHELGNLFFCHRWLLLGFKREFSFMDSLRCFEILSSHHLELSSLEAEKALRKEEMLEFANTGGDTRTTQMPQKEYTFEVFMCAALLMEFRDALFDCKDTGMVFTCVNGLKFELDDILTKSERLFFMYCRKTVEDSFHLVEDTPKEEMSLQQKLLNKLKGNTQ
ncbi:rab GTPase-activating protein 22-like isoform X2 [Haliotis rufescens]|uniref:rab GTPase-activating protein 22-like isoform X2 n=1 Tax=Haliotis rufescens TaxID=6454 RepID=UPI00201F79BC|nr:rab GTPase-activating protein 22-like isoform X2 [Haliotis rufescens]